MADDVDSRRVLLDVQMAALGALLEWTLARDLARARDPAAEADALLRRAEGLCRSMTFPGLDAASSDLAAQEFRDALVRHLLRARALATGRRFDPDAYQSPIPDSVPLAAPLDPAVATPVDWAAVAAARKTPRDDDASS